MADSITIRGFVAGDVRPGTTNGGVNTASFRMGSTDRHYDRATQQWVDGETNWFTVQAYRQLAGNIAGSLKKGQRVVVMGRLKLRQWENDGKTYHSAQIEAESIGHDLSWGTANYQRNSSAQAPAPAAVPARDPSDPIEVDGQRIDPLTGECLGLAGSGEGTAGRGEEAGAGESPEGAESGAGESSEEDLTEAA
ncbi:MULTISPECIES: single-stranded DNA-binding protein [Arthrobacter]|uniref:Single-stranded DNA-binding protein n=2 Tax=Arthrobacter TaxID=1663 RepID=A0ABU9KFH9_9MICC|nr:single-stranded DNA-binding protein [Arthrobacter sp. YJM1]MDP5225636.1 single-stranded DNA-binding protein [Arthrobacter sp. YJM1]